MKAKNDEPNFTEMLEQAELAKEFKKLNPLMRIYFKEKTMRQALDLERKANEIYNKNKHWWQKKKPTQFMADLIPRVFILPPFYLPDYEETEELIERYMRGYTKKFHPELLNK